MKFPNDSKGGCIDKGYPKNIQIFKGTGGGEEQQGKISILRGSKNPGRNHDIF